MDVSFPGLRNQVCASQTTCLYITKHVLHVIYKSMYVYIKYIQINAVLHICIYIHRNTYVCAYIIIIIYTNTYIIYIYYTNIYKYIFIYMHTTIYIWYIMYINNYAHLVRSHLYIYILHPWLHLPDISPSPGLEHAQCRHLGAALLLTPEGWIHGDFTSKSGDFLILMRKNMEKWGDFSDFTIFTKKTFPWISIWFQGKHRDFKP